jgi:23S rRNA (cytosine1962-C5)-methyltransferase
VLSALTDVVLAERLVLRLGRTIQGQPQHLYGLGDGEILFGPHLDGPVIFRENGLRFEADPIHGQKTGFFLDQRENRARAEKLASRKAVLNVFAYTGGFSLYAGRGGARAIVSVDASRPALAAAVRNFALNRDHPSVAKVVDKHEVLAEDAFEALARLGRSRRFDLVIIDPPAFAKKRAEVERAMSAYQRLTRLGLGVLQPGGTLVMASCSSRVSADEFFVAVHRAAVQAGRPLREIERTGHPLDHPVGFKQGAYLKCLFATAP